jgi:hypothetical protein
MNPTQRCPWRRCRCRCRGSLFFITVATRRGSGSLFFITVAARQGQLPKKVLKTCEFTENFHFKERYTVKLDEFHRLETIALVLISHRLENLEISKVTAAAAAQFTFFNYRRGTAAAR